MSAAEVLRDLDQAGLVLSAEIDLLHVDGDPAALTPELVARVRQVKPALLLVASGAWQRELAGWPEDLRVEWAERAAIRELDGQQPRDLAERAAFLEVREATLAPVADLLAGAREAFGAGVTLTLRASARPPEPDDEDEGPSYGFRHDPRPVVSPLCCGGCGCKSLTLEGLGPCSKCGWRRPARAAG